ncbi:putative drug resistance efflux protein [Gordonia araii NBRC 100433]|uniref:Putative drug resistance efflux protein n=1 Tax=Gordonia araii NBRC 100433 TaxID=1073574 RepID=G7H3F3_9ACTN|nr:MFS transporter [Gordonia araii]NNG96496.1 MFS transporter [Gordonia araii NBRC 100433]GAB10378.1 putative drug resistance efflux protein [Gordonia araii NBRC 100433]
MRSFLADTRPLANDDFRHLWIANIVTVIGAQLTVVAVPMQIYSITQSSAYVGLTGIFGLVPLIGFGLWGGALADVFDRRKILLVTTLGLIVTAFLFFAQAAAGLNNVWVLLVLFAVQQAFFAVNQPTRSAVLPRILPLAYLPAANSLNMTVMQAGAIVGPLLGGLLVPVLGYSMLYLADSLSLLTTLWAVWRLPALVPERSGDGARPRAGLRSILDGFSYLRGHKVLLMSFVVDLIAMVFGMPRILFPEIAHENFGGRTDGGWQVALLFAAIPLGAVLGGVFSGWVSRVRRQGLAVVVSILVWGGSMAVAGFALFGAHGTWLPMLPVVVVALVIGGAADMVSSAFRMTMLQSAADDAVRGRLQGVFIVVVAGGPRLADVGHGAAAAMVGTAAATAGGGVAVIVGTVIAALAVPAFVRYVVTPRVTEA